MTRCKKMSKPDWVNAPEWANYVAMDDDGEWKWYENEPIVGCYCWDCNKGKELSAGFDINWENSLEKRP